MSVNLVQPVKVGDIFYSSWGYDQTNVDYFAVTEVSKTGKTATFIVLCNVATAESSGPTDYLAADATSARCSNCYRGIRPFVKADGSKVWRHTAGQTERCNPWRDNDERTAAPETFKRRIRYYEGRAAANWTSYAGMYAWDGKPKYATAAGWGR